MHPYQNSEVIRHSPLRIIGEMCRAAQMLELCCPVCTGHNTKTKEIESHPVFPGQKSSAQLCQCETCGSKWEVAYSLTYSMCILRRGQY